MKQRTSRFERFECISRLISTKKDKLYKVRYSLLNRKDTETCEEKMFLNILRNKCFLSCSQIFKDLKPNVFINLVLTRKKSVRITTDTIATHDENAALLRCKKKKRNSKEVFFEIHDSVIHEISSRVLRDSINHFSVGRSVGRSVRP